MLTLLSFHPLDDVNTIYDLSFPQSDGTPYDFGNLRGKVVLVANTASSCGFSPQYRELQSLYEKYQEAGLEILAFPSSDFGGQEPLNNKQILQTCSLNFGVSFPIFEKSRIKGKNANPIFLWLKSKSSGKNFFKQPVWNFQKFLINKKGKLVKVYLPFISPSSEKIKHDVEKLLNE